MIGVGKVAKHDALGAHELVARDELAERRARLVELAHDFLGGEVVHVDPRPVFRVDLEGCGEFFFERLWPGHFVEPGHALGVVDAVSLELGEQRTLRRILLREQNLERVFQDRLDDRNRVHRESRGVLVEDIEGCDRECRERLVHLEVPLEVVHECDGATEVIGLVAYRDDLRFLEAAE